MTLLLVLALVAASAPDTSVPSPQGGTLESKAVPPAATSSTSSKAPASERGVAASKPGDKPPPPTHIQADHIEYRYKERQTVMTGKPLVTLIREDATLVCRKLTADSNDSGDIRDALCEGDVKLTRGERIVTCARANYEGLSGRVICRGDPILRDGESVIACDEVIYDLDQDKVFLKHPKGTLVQKPGQPLPVAKERSEHPR